MDVGKCLGWWERGSLVAPSPEMRFVINPCLLAEWQHCSLSLSERLESGKGEA